MNELLEKRMAQYVLVRDKIADIDERRKKAVEVKNMLAAEIMQFLIANKIENLRTSAGTCYISEKTTASLADNKAFFDFVVASERWELLDKRANSTACADYAQQHGGALPPGVNLNTVKTLGLRRANGGSNGSGNNAD